jgi:hypothetical protein
MTRETNVESNIRIDIAEIKQKLVSLADGFSDFKKNNEKYCDSMTSKVDEIENRQILTEQKTSGMAVFQSAFAIVIGAIAAYLGVSKK